MTENQPEIEPDRPLDDDVDFLLATVIEVIDKPDGSGDEFAYMTLVVQGVAVTGKLCSRKSWMTAMSKQTAPDGSNTWPSSLGKALLRRLENVDDVPAPEVPVRRRFFHMIDVTILDGSNRLHTPTFRGQLSQVGGFTFGTIETD